MKKFAMLILILLFSALYISCSSSTEYVTTEYLHSTIMEEDPSALTFERRRKMPSYDLESLLAADQIIIGTVTGVLPSYFFHDNLTDNSHIITNIVIDVKETLKGNHYDQVAVLRMGGIAEKASGERVQIITNAPHYTKDEEVLLFLKEFDVYSPPVGFKTSNHFYTKAYGKWSSDLDSKFVLDYEGVRDQITLEQLKEKINKQ